MNKLALSLALVGCTSTAFAANLTSVNETPLQCKTGQQKALVVFATEHHGQSTSVFCADPGGLDTEAGIYALQKLFGAQIHDRALIVNVIPLKG